MTMIEFRFCLRDISKVSNISCRAAFVGVFRRLRRRVTVPSRSSAIKASIPVVVKQTAFKKMIIILRADKDNTKVQSNCIWVTITRFKLLFRPNEYNKPQLQAYYSLQNFHEKKKQHTKIETESSIYIFRAGVSGQCPPVAQRKFNRNTNEMTWKLSFK